MAAIDTREAERAMRAPRAVGRPPGARARGRPHAVHASRRAGRPLRASAGGTDPTRDGAETAAAGGAGAMV